MDQADPEHGLQEREKEKLAQTIEFFRFLQLHNNKIVKTLGEAVACGIDFDNRTGKVVISQKQKILMEKDDIRWRIIRILRWTPYADPEIVNLMKAMIDSPNWRDCGYALGYLGKVAGRLMGSNEELSQAITGYLYNRRMEMIRDRSPIIVLEMVKAFMGDWDARQRHQRAFLAGSEMAAEGLRAIAEDDGVDPAVRRSAVQGLNFLSKISGEGSAVRRSYKMLFQSNSLLCQDEIQLLSTGVLSPVKRKIHITSEDQVREHMRDRQQLLFYRGRLHPYTRMEYWENVGLTLGGGTSLLDFSILDKKWLAIRKTSPANPKYPRRAIIPAIERVTSSLGWLLGLDSLSKIQLIENEEFRSSYFSYAVGQNYPLPLDLYQQIFRIKRAGEDIASGSKKNEHWLEDVIRNLLLKMYGVSDMDAPAMERHLKFGELICENRTGSTIAYIRGKEEEAAQWFESASRVLENPEFLDKIKFFNWVVGNEDQFGYRNILVANRRSEDRGKLFLVDFASCFKFLQRDDLDWRPHLRRFYSNLRTASEQSAPIFLSNIKPLIINFLSLTPKIISDVLEEIQYGELRYEEKLAVQLLLMAEKDVLAKELVKWSGMRFLK